MKIRFDLSPDDLVRSATMYVANHHGMCPQDLVANIETHTDGIHVVVTAIVGENNDSDEED